MPNSLTDVNPNDIITHVEQNFSRAQATGLNCLIFLALREQTSIAYQRKELGFEDIPEQVIAWCDGLEEDDLLDLAARITAGLLDNLGEVGTQYLYDLFDEVTAAALHTKSAQIQTTQGLGK
ncbi:MAG: hypothetical protein V7K21_13360 [Nostoc sp.]|uniref:hypothetical protein n=1 Tax=Nostoc sp. TaxID=1180 RepID=UPI002FF60646